jgi:2-haloacid dehalogenase
MDDMLVPVFDLGGVFVNWDPMNLFRKLFDTEEEAQWFQDNVCTLDWNLELDAGLKYEDGVAKLITRFPRYWREIQAYNFRWKEMVSGYTQGTIDIHDELIAADIPTFAITNFSIEKWISVLDYMPFMSKFDGVVVSGAEGLVKPDSRIYKLFCDRYSLAPSSCIFVDDKEINVAAAQNFGMQALHFTSPEQLRGDLIELGLPLAEK